MLKKVFIIGALALLLIGGSFTGNANAAPVDANAAITNAQTAADTGFMLMSAALVLLMTPGLAFFYGGFVRSRNILNTLMMSFVVMAIVGVTWILWGYSLAFAPNLSVLGKVIGNLNWAFIDPGVVKLDTTAYLPHFPYENALKAADANYSDLTSYAPTIPHQAFMIYQAMFAIITPALISGQLLNG